MLLANCRICAQRDRHRRGELSAKTSATSMSFHTHRNWKIASEAIAGQPEREERPCGRCASSRAAVHPGRLQQVAGNAGEEVAQQEDRERQAERDVEQHHAGMLAVDAERPKHARRRDERHLDRHHQQRDDQRRTASPARELDPGEGVGGQRADATTSTVDGTVMSTVFQKEP